MKKPVLTIILLVCYLIIIPVIISTDETQDIEITDSEHQETTVRKITDEEFQEINDLILRAKKAGADVFEQQDYEAALSNLTYAEEHNDDDPEKAFEYLELAKQQAQSAYYNAYKHKADNERKKSDDIYTDIERGGVNREYLDAATKTKELYHNAQKEFETGNYPIAYEKHLACADVLTDLIAQIDKAREDYNARTEHVKKLIDKAEEMEAEKYAADDFTHAKDSFSRGLDNYTNNSIDMFLSDMSDAETYALEAINKSQLAASDKKNAVKTTYIVKRLPPGQHECLWMIAGYDFIYNDPSLWPTIYQANKNIISNPHLIYPGQTLVIPELE